MFELVFFVKEGYVKRLGKVLPKKVRRAGLQSLAVLHHGFNAIGFQSPGKTFVGRFNAFNHGHGHKLFGKFGIHIKHLAGFLFGFLARGVGGVAFLPQKFGRAQKQTGAHFPTHHIGPLVYQNRQIAIRLNPALIGIPDNGFGGRAHNKFFFQTGRRVHTHPAVVVGFKAIVRYHRALFGKPFHVVGLAREKRFWYKERKISILMTRVFEHLIQSRLHFFPNGVAVGLDDHAAAHRRTLG